MVQLHVRLRKSKTSTKCQLLDAQDLGVGTGIHQELLEILNVLDLARLGHPVAFFLETPFPIELHDFLAVLEGSHEEKKTAYNCASSAFAMVTVEYCNPFRVTG